MLKFKVFKIKKTAWKNLNDEKHRQSENRELEAFERVIILFLERIFSIDESHCCLTTFCRKTFLMASLMRND